MNTPSLEGLKQAQQQLRESEQAPKNAKNFPGRNPPFTISRTVSESKKETSQKPDYSPPKAGPHSSFRSEQTPGWVSSQDWQKEILAEKQRLEGASKEIESWQQKIQERLGMINELENQSQKINKELEELQQKIVLVKKENNTILYQIKDKNGYRNRDFKTDSRE